MISQPSELCLVLVHQGLCALGDGNLATADERCAAAVGATRTLPRAEAEVIFPLAVLAMCLVRTRQGGAEEAAKLRAAGLKLLDQFHTLPGSVLYPQLLASVLNDLQEYHRAIPFYEQSAQLLSERNEPLGVARNLKQAGLCYCRCGLQDHGAVPLRAAIRIYRDHPGDPHLPEALLTLGNALRKRSPAEAEAAYIESAAFYESKMQLSSASPAWVNLGILCSEQERHAEALAWYQKALRIREHAPNTPPARIGTLLNNMANCHRRAGNFAEAHATLDRALTLLRPEDGSYLASAYGTRGLIFSDQQYDTDAIPWLQKAIDAHQRMPSPNIESIAINLGATIVSLRRLGRTAEAEAAEGRLQQIRASQQNFPQANLLLDTASGLSDRVNHASGAVLLEIACGPRSGTSRSVADALLLADRIAREIDLQALGFYGGRITIPESATFLFYGDDAEALFDCMQPIFADYLIAEGAIVSIRQGTQLRQVSLPTRVM